MDRLTWVVAGGVLALVAAGIIVAVAVRGSAAPPDLETTAGVALTYAQALQRGDPERAWDLLARSTRAAARRAQFILHASGESGQDDGARLAVEDVRLEGATASLTLVRTIPSSGGFLGLAVAASFTLTGLSQLLYSGLGRLLGVERPGGVGGNLLQAAAGPASALLVYGPAGGTSRQPSAGRRRRGRHRRTAPGRRTTPVQLPDGAAGACAGRGGPGRPAVDAG